MCRFVGHSFFFFLSFDGDTAHGFKDYTRVFCSHHPPPSRVNVSLPYPRPLRGVGFFLLFFFIENPYITHAQAHTCVRFVRPIVEIPMFYTHVHTRSPPPPPPSSSPPPPPADECSPPPSSRRLSYINPRTRRRRRLVLSLHFERAFVCSFVRPSGVVLVECSAFSVFILFFLFLRFSKKS